MSKFSFFNLPSEVCADIFVQWIESKDLVNLDTAMMNHFQRKLFLEMIHDEQFILRGSESLVLSSYLYWLGHRNIKVDKVALVTSFLEETDQVSRIDMSKVQSLVFRNSCGRRCKPAEPTLLQWLLNFAVKTDPYMTLFVRCGNLKHVEFGDEAHSSFGKIGMFCAKLQSVKAVHCKGLNDTAVENIAQHCREHIHTVVLRACDQLTSASVYALAENCPNLTHLDVSYGSTLSERCLIRLAEKCPKLEHLNFEGLMNISDQVIATVAKNCKNLRYFNIDYYKGMSHNGIDPLALKLIAESCTSVNDFIAPDFHYKVRQVQSQLQAGVLQGRSQLKLKGVYTRLPKLRNILLNSPNTVSSLHASGCKYFNDECLLLATQSSTTHLVSLAIAGCEDVTDAGLAHVAEHCPNLAAFDATATLITDTGLVTLARRCREITTLQVKKCNFITDVGILTSTRVLTELRSVDLSGCVLLTDVALRAVAANCPKLRELDVTNCPLVTKAAVAELGITYPDLTCHSFWEFYLP